MDRAMTVATCKFGEKLSLGNADTHRAIIDGFFDDPSVDTIMFDMENVRLCDSYGLKFLLTYHRKAEATGKKLILFRPDFILQEMLDNTKLSNVFKIIGASDVGQ
jgi:anti-anti-sigma factor